MTPPTAPSVPAGEAAGRGGPDRPVAPHALLATADALLTGGSGSLERCWQRACAALLRNALEQVLAGYWRQRRRGGADRAGMRTQLLVLAVVVDDPAVAATATRAWHGLSRALHHHSYELPPTAAELRSWYRDVNRLAGALSEPPWNGSRAARSGAEAPPDANRGTGVAGGDAG